MKQMMRFKSNNTTPLHVQNESFYYKIPQMLVQCEMLQASPLPNKPPIAKAYKYVQNELHVNDYFNFLLKLEPKKPSNDKLIKSKMRVKLFTWLEKIALTTFKFSIQTLITAGSIIDQYLEKTNETPSSLQLIGCTGLFIASKLREETIVDPQCYATASCNVFTKKQLLEKEKLMYLRIDWIKVKGGALQGLRIGCELLNLKKSLGYCEQLLWNCLKDEEICQWKEVQMVYGVLSLATINTSQSIQTKCSLNLLKQL